MMTSGSVHGLYIIDQLRENMKVKRDFVKLKQCYPTTKPETKIFVTQSLGKKNPFQPNQPGKGNNRKKKSLSLCT